MPLVSKAELQNIDREARVEIARKVGCLLLSDKRSSDRSAALDLARLLAEDVSIAVRVALSEQVRAAPYLPDELVEKLASDIEQVSCPFVMGFKAVDDKFLISMLDTCGDELQNSIAERKEVSEALTYAICDVACVRAVSTLMSNDGAILNENSAVRVTQRFPEDTPLLESMAKRADLPIEIVKSIIFKVSRKYSEYLASKFELTADYSEYIISLAERQVFHQTLELSPDSEVYNYFCQLNDEGAITSDLLFSYIQKGFVKVFTMAVAAKTGKAPEILRKALEVDSSKVLGKLLKKCGYSRAVVGAMVVAFERQNPKRV